jgi:predicted MFS family arabinose efflux permease
MTTEVTLATAPGPNPQRQSPSHRRKQGRSTPWALLRRRIFRAYFIGSTVSNLGTWLQSTCQVVLAYQITHSVFAVGLVVAAQFAAIPIVSPLAAVVSNHWGSRTTLVVSQLASACVAAAMAVRYSSGLLGEHTLILGALGLGLMYSLALPLQVSMVPTLVPMADAEAAIEMNSASYNAGRALAPALSVLIIATVGPESIFAANAASFVLFALVLMRLKSSAADTVADGGAAPPPRRRARLTDGLRVALIHPRILLLLAIVGAVTFADDPVMVLSPALSRTVLHLPSDWAGYFIAALGWGAVIGSLRPRQRREVDAQRASKTAAVSLLVLAGSVILFAVGISPLVSLLCAFMAGAAALRTGAAAQTPIVVRDKQSAASVGALWAIAWAGTKPVASFLDGWLASQIGFIGAAALLALPAITLAAFEILLREETKYAIKVWAKNNLRRPGWQTVPQSFSGDPDPLARSAEAAAASLEACSE